MSLRWQSIVIDCTDPLLVATFWGGALGLEVHGPDDGVYWIEPGGESPDILFLHVPEQKSVKDRIHIDLRPDDQAAEVERLTSLGATRIDIGQGDVTWVVMADPEANEFCVLRPRAGA
ncbi:MAG: VOC family protein [Candidatus Dormibacteraeota bacterium]|nr:VOC family protein [Candidatus Dormibacteraeota bacterium]